MKTLRKEAVSAETGPPTRISVLWRDWVVAGPGPNYLSWTSSSPLEQLAVPSFFCVGTSIL